MAPPLVRAQTAGRLAPTADLAGIERAVAFVLDAERANGIEMSLTLMSDPEIAALNAEYLHHEGPTDVISFLLEGPGGDGVGDVYIGAEQALRQAAEAGIPAGEELLRLAIHGTLHVLGYDHPAEDDREASPMYRRQEELLALFLRNDHHPGH